MFFLEEIAIGMLGGGFKIDLPHGILPTYTGVKFAFVTPGAQDPDLHITGEGFALKGALNWLDHELGAMDVSVSPKSGIKADGKIDDMHLGPLQLKNNHFKMRMGLKSVPSMTVDADMEMLGITDKFHFDFGKDGIDFSGTSDFGDLFKFDMKASIGGEHLTTASGIHNADIRLDASLSSDPEAFLRNLGSGKVKKKFEALDKGLESAVKKVDAAKKKVDELEQIRFNRGHILLRQSS